MKDERPSTGKWSAERTKDGFYKQERVLRTRIAHDPLLIERTDLIAMREIVGVVASLNLSDIGSMEDGDILYAHGGVLTVAVVRAAARLMHG